MSNALEGAQAGNKPELCERREPAAPGARAGAGMSDTLSKLLVLHWDDLRVGFQLRLLPSPPLNM